MNDKRYQRHIRFAACGAVVTGAIALSSLTSYYGDTFTGAYVHGLIGWFCISLCGGLLLKVVAYLLLARMTYTPELATVSDGERYGGWFCIALATAMWLASAMSTANVFLGFVSFSTRDVPTLVTDSIGMMLMMGAGAFMYQTFIGTTYPLPSNS